MKWRPLRAAAGLAAILAVAASLWYVTAPPKGTDGYRARAAYTAETLRSQVGTARISGDAVAAGDLPHAGALVLFEEAEEDASAAASGFESFEPPSGSDAVREEFVTLAGDVSEALAALRISAQQEDWERIPNLVDRLPSLARRLDRFVGRTQ